MKTETFVRRTRIEAPAGDVFRWHCSPGALQSLVPPWESVVVEEEGEIADGALVVLRVGLGPLHLRWISRISNVIAGRQFRDVQVRGPFALWEHTHRMVPDGDRSCWLEDWILYVLPGGRLGRWLGRAFVHRKLDRMFDYRHRVTREAFAEPVSAL